MDLFEFMGKTLFEDVPELFFEKIPRDVETLRVIDNCENSLFRTVIQFQQ